MKRIGLLLAALVATAAPAQTLLATLSSTDGPATYVASGTGAALLIQCPGQIIRYVQGSAASPPVATGSSASWDFYKNPEARTLELDQANDRISITGGTARYFTCRIYAGTASSTAGRSSTADLQLYVDPTGNDTNACTATGVNACLTIQGALNKPPKNLRHRVTVNVAAGNYAGFTLSGFMNDPAFQRATAGILIDGPALANVTPTTGTATGTATSGTAGSGTTFGTLTDTTQSWTVNDAVLVGRLVSITAGTGSGQSAIIVSNTATALTIAGTWTAPDATSTYALVNNGAILTSAAALIPDPTGTTTAVSAAAIQILDNFANGLGMITIRNIGIAVGAGNGMFVQNARVQVTRMVATSANTFNTTAGLGASPAALTVTSSSAIGSISTLASGYGSVVAFNNSYASGTTGGTSGGRATVLSSRLNTAAQYTGGSSGSMTNVRCDCASAANSACLKVGSGTVGVADAPMSGVGITGMDVTNCTYGVLAQTGLATFTVASTFSGNALTYSAAASFGGSIILPSALTITSGAADLSVDNGIATDTFSSLGALNGCLANLATSSRICRL